MSSQRCFLNLLNLCYYISSSLLSQKFPLAKTRFNKFNLAPLPFKLRKSFRFLKWTTRCHLNVFPWYLVLSLAFYGWKFPRALFFDGRNMRVKLCWIKLSQVWIWKNLPFTRFSHRRWKCWTFPCALLKNNVTMWINFLIK